MESSHGHFREDAEGRRIYETKRKLLESGATSPVLYIRHSVIFRLKSLTYRFLVRRNPRTVDDAYDVAFLIRCSCVQCFKPDRTKYERRAWEPMRQHVPPAQFAAPVLRNNWYSFLSPARRTLKIAEGSTMTPTVFSAAHRLAPSSPTRRELASGTKPLFNREALRASSHSLCRSFTVVPHGHSLC